MFAPHSMYSIILSASSNVTVFENFSFILTCHLSISPDQLSQRLLPSPVLNMSSANIAPTPVTVYKPAIALEKNLPPIASSIA